MRQVTTFTAALMTSFAASAVAQAPPEHVELDLILHAHVEGRLFPHQCDAQRGSPRCYPLASAKTLATQLGESRGVEPITLSLGDAIFPGSAGRYLLEQHQEALLADIQASMRYDLIVPGNQELSPVRPAMLSYFEAATRAALPMSVANMTCDISGGAQVLCDAASAAPGEPAYRVIERGGLKIGLFGLLDPRITETVFKENLAGVTLADPAKRAAELVKQLRAAQRCDLVIAVMHTPAADASAAIDMAARVSGLDLIITSASPEVRPSDLEQNDSLGHVQMSRTGALIVGAANKGEAAVLMNMTVERRHHGWRIRNAEATLQALDNYPHDPELRDSLELAHDAFCSEWGQPIDIRSGKNHTRDEFERFVLDTMRFEAEAEVAFMNKHAIASTGYFEGGGALTYADLYALLPFDNELIVARMSGAKLRELAKESRLLVAGMSREGGSLKINGRPLQDARLYRIATNDFVATGGDRLVAPTWFEGARKHTPSWSKGPVRLNALVRRALIEGEGDVLYPDLAERFMWNIEGSFTGSYNRVGVTNPSPTAYTQSQLSVASTDQLDVEAKLQATADKRDHAWTSTLLTQYAITRSSQGGDISALEFDESKDLIRLKSLYEFAGFRARHPAWWVALPFGEAQVQTEFDIPEARAWRIFELTGISGARFRLTDRLSVKTGANIRGDINDPTGSVSYGLNVGYTLNRLDLMRLFGTPIQLESELDYFYNDIGKQNTHELRSRSKLYYAFMSKIFFTTSLNLFAYRTMNVGIWGRNLELMFGLNYLWSGARQTFPPRSRSRD